MKLTVKETDDPAVAKDVITNFTAAANAERGYPKAGDPSIVKVTGFLEALGNPGAASCRAS